MLFSICLALNTNNHGKILLRTVKLCDKDNMDFQAQRQRDRLPIWSMVSIYLNNTIDKLNGLKFSFCFVEKKADINAHNIKLWEVIGCQKKFIFISLLSLKVVDKTHFHNFTYFNFAFETKSLEALC